MPAVNVCATSWQQMLRFAPRLTWVVTNDWSSTGVWAEATGGNARDARASKRAAVDRVMDLPFRSGRPAGIPDVTGDDRSPVERRMMRTIRGTDDEPWDHISDV